jgi:hypothetical protein
VSIGVITRAREEKLQSQTPEGASLRPADPDHTTLNELRVIRPRTLHQINARVLVSAQTYRLAQSYELRADGGVTETNIRCPLFTGLLLDGARVLSRLLQRADVV